MGKEKELTSDGARQPQKQRGKAPHWHRLRAAGQPARAPPHPLLRPKRPPHGQYLCPLPQGRMPLGRHEGQRLRGQRPTAPKHQRRRRPKTDQRRSAEANGRQKRRRHRFFLECEAGGGKGRPMPPHSQKQQQKRGGRCGGLFAGMFASPIAFAPTPTRWLTHGAQHRFQLGGLGQIGGRWWRRGCCCCCLQQQGVAVAEAPPAAGTRRRRMRLKYAAAVMMAAVMMAMMMMPLKEKVLCY